jgi:hypothetical protein
VEEAVRAINFRWGYFGGLCFGLVGGGLCTAIAGTQRIGLSGGMLGWVFIGVALTVWAACFVWHDYLARRALGRPASAFGALARWFAWAVALPVTIAGLLVVLYLGWDLIAPALKVRGIDDSTIGCFIAVVGGVIVPVVTLTGTAIYRRIKRRRVRSRTRTATAAPEVRRAYPVRQTQSSGSVGREAFLLDYLLSLCHNDRALCGRLIELERRLHPYLPREELLELVIEKWRVDNR